VLEPQRIKNFLVLLSNEKAEVLRSSRGYADFSAGYSPYGTTDLASLASGKRSSSGQQRRFL
jgi:hypothetical protein